MWIVVFWLQKQIVWFRILTPFISFPFLRSPNKRYKCLISSTTTAEIKKKDKDSLFNDGFLIHPSNEAFLVWAVENGYTRWKQPYLVARAKDDKKKLEELQATKDQDLEPKYTTSKGGQSKFGGLKEGAVERFSYLCREITQNRKDNKESIEALEKRILKKVRDLKGRDEAERKQAEKRGARKSVVPKVVDVDPNFQEDDFEQWI